jgi:hypothetical protein
MNFEKWLIKHKKDDTMFGDLARDLIDSRCKTIKESFEKYPPCKAAYEAYKNALSHYILALENELADLMLEFKMIKYKEGL